MAPNWLQSVFPRSSLLAPKIDLGAQGDFWMHLGRLLAPFWHPLGSILVVLGSILLPFGSILLPFRSSGSLLAPFWFHFGRFFLILIVVRRFFSISIVFGSVLVALPMGTQFLGHPTPQGTHSKIIRESQTVGTLTFLGPGRACCRRQLKIDE